MTAQAVENLDAAQSTPDGLGNLAVSWAPILRR